MLVGEATSLLTCGNDAGRSRTFPAVSDRLLAQSWPSLWDARCVKWIGAVVAILGVALAAYAATFLVSAALVLFIVGMALFAVGVWAVHSGRPRDEASA